MRYSILIYIKRMCDTLLEAAQYLQAAPEDPARDSLLENGNDMLMQIETVLKQHEEDMLSPVPLKLLDEIKVLWDAAAFEDVRLQESIVEFSKALPKEIFYQVRAVFFAELGEKWDAMESVYQSMRADPRFDPIIVRTPVGRVVNQNGKRKQEILYKDFLAPMGISSLSYEEYSLEEDCPELAFISQPYESCTIEEFWPETIAKQTRLVYLPYFLPFFMLEDHKETLCRLPVYRYAWRVIGSSEKHYKFYRKYALNGGGNMLVTGLPKVDPLVRLRKSSPPIPNSWKSALENRKVILWNTWYEYQSSSLSYFDQIVEWLKTHEDCAIIWRPHPMTDTVTKLYYPPEMYKQLQNHIKTAKELPNMICDEESSCSASFAYSIAQISDYSSLMSQYLLLDKPLLWIQNKRQTGSSFKESIKGFFIEASWMEEAPRIEEVFEFLERILQGTDKKAELRKAILQRDLPLADGRSGERICNVLWEELHKEDLDLCPLDTNNGE